MSSKKVKASSSASVSSLKAGVNGGAKASSSGSSTISKISTLEKQLSSTSANLNPLVDLLEYLTSAKSSAKVKAAAAHALHNVFSSLIRQGRLIGRVKDDGNGEAAAAVALKAVREWAKARWSEYTDKLCEMLSGSEESLATASLNILMSLLRTTSEHLSALQAPPIYTFDVALWRRILSGLLATQEKPSPAVQADFVNRYLNYNDDIRFYFLRTAADLTNSSAQSDSFRTTLLFYLESLTTMPSNESDINSFWAGQPKNKTGKALKPKARVSKKRKASEMVTGDGSTGIFDDTDDSSGEEEEVANIRRAQQKKVGQHELFSLNVHRRVFTQAWTAFLSLILSEDDIKRVLVMLHRQVMPHLLDPAILIDFLADCCDYGGTVALLALNGLFTLITKHRLDYPHFYLNLYRLLDSQVLHVRYRPRFLRMLDTFLSSTHLPIALVASFMKRLARLTLSAPPAATVSIIPFLYNLMKRHPATMVLIHSADQVEPGALYQDPYHDEEPDPLKTGAIDSSLWEIVSLRSHYMASISTLAKIFGEAFTKPNYNMEDFLDHAYSTMFQTEITRKLKNAPAMNPAVPSADLKYLFPAPPSIDEDSEEAALAMEGKGDIVSRLWRFG